MPLSTATRVSFFSARTLHPVRALAGKDAAVLIGLLAGADVRPGGVGDPGAGVARAGDDPLPGAAVNGRHTAPSTGVADALTARWSQAVPAAGAQPSPVVRTRFRPAGAVTV